MSKLISPQTSNKPASLKISKATKKDTKKNSKNKTAKNSSKKNSKSAMLLESAVK